MEQIQPFITPIVFVITIIGAVLYLRADGRANRQELKADITALAVVVDGIRETVAQIDRRLTALEVKVDAMDAKFDAKIDALDAKLDARIDALEERTELKFAATDAKIVSLAANTAAGFRAIEAQFNARMDALQTEFNARMDLLEVNFDAKISALSQQMQHNHQDLLVRLAFHHHGDGRYPVAPSSEPNPAFPAGGDA